MGPTYGQTIRISSALIDEKETDNSKTASAKWQTFFMTYSFDLGVQVILALTWL